MSLISEQIAHQNRPTDNGLLERIERDGDNHNLYAVLALISRTADIIQNSDYLNESLEDESWLAFDALDKLRGKLSELLHDEATGVAESNRREDAIADYNDFKRKSESA